MSDKVIHEFEPVYNKHSKILILGTFPSVKSREYNFYYGHPQNRFWKVLAQVTHNNIPNTIQEKKEFLLKNNIALWDVVQSCTITGSSDSSIRDVIPCNLNKILDTSNISRIYGNGAKACELYEKYILPTTHEEIIKLPSTSPANASFSLEKLVIAWSTVKEFL